MIYTQHIYNAPTHKIIINTPFLELHSRRNENDKVYRYITGFNCIDMQIIWTIFLMDNCSYINFKLTMFCVVHNCSLHINISSYQLADKHITLFSSLGVLLDTEEYIGFCM